MGKSVGRHDSRQDEIHELLARKAREGKTVVRLKGGDPFVFGRGGEEAEYLAGEGVPFEVIPGVSSALAAPLSAGIAVTHRDAASAVAIVTGHEAKKDQNRLDWQALSRIDTLVFLMAVANVRRIAELLVAHGRDPDTPAAIVQMAFWHDEHVATGTLATIADEVERAGIKPPATLVVGEVVRLREKLKGSERDLRRRADSRSRFEPSPGADQLLRLATGATGSQLLGFALETGAVRPAGEAVPGRDARAAHRSRRRRARGDARGARRARARRVDARRLPQPGNRVPVPDERLGAEPEGRPARAGLRSRRPGARWPTTRGGDRPARPRARRRARRPTARAARRSRASWRRRSSSGSTWRPAARSCTSDGAAAPTWTRSRAGGRRCRSPPATPSTRRIRSPRSRRTAAAAGTGACSSRACSRRARAARSTQLLAAAAAASDDRGLLVLHDAFLPGTVLPPADLLLGALARHAARGGCRTWSTRRLADTLRGMGYQVVAPRRWPPARCSSPRKGRRGRELSGQPGAARPAGGRRRRRADCRAEDRRPPRGRRGGHRGRAARRAGGRPARGGGPDPPPPPGLRGRRPRRRRRGRGGDRRSGGERAGVGGRARRRGAGERRRRARALHVHDPGRRAPR